MSAKPRSTSRARRTTYERAVDHWIIAPVLLPAMTAALLILALRHSLTLQRVVSMRPCWPCC